MVRRILAERRRAIRWGRASGPLFGRQGGRLFGRQPAGHPAEAAIRSGGPVGHDYGHCVAGADIARSARFHAELLSPAQVPTGGIQGDLVDVANPDTDIDLTVADLP